MTPTHGHPRARDLLVALLLFAAVLAPGTGAAHNAGGGLFGYTVSVEVRQGTLTVESTVEIPASVLIREARDLLSGRPDAGRAEQESAIASRVLDSLERGTLCLWNRHPMTMERVEGVQEKTGFGGYDFFQYRLLLRGALPASREGAITVINRNYTGYPSIYQVSLDLSGDYELVSTNLDAPGQSFVLDTQTGRPWSRWEGLRSLRFEIRPTPLWKRLAGRASPAHVDTRSAHATATGRAGTARRETGDPGPAPEGRLKAMLLEPEWTPTMLALGLALAFFLGALHALGPGHGKALVGAYLVGTSGRPADAVWLGLLVTFSHVASVLTLGVISLAASRYFVPEQILPYLEMLSAGLLVFLGGWMLRTRWPRRGRHSHEPHHHHGHETHHGHAHAHPHPDPAGSPGKPARARWQEIVSLGVSGGMVPCPSALAILLMALALHKLVPGLAMIVAFSLGLAAVLVAVGLALVWTRSFLKPLGREGGWIAWLPVASSVVILSIGLIMLGRRLYELGVPL